MPTDQPKRDGIELLVDCAQLCSQICDGVFDQARAAALRDDLDAYLAQLGNVRQYVERRAEARTVVLEPTSLERTIERAVEARERAEQRMAALGKAVPR